MCSIGGFISKDPLPAAIANRLCTALLWHGESRGRQSAGIWVNGQVLKKAQAPQEFVRRDDFDALFAKPVSIALTHTRQPTSGGTGDEQAHPFWVGSTVSVHNGWLTNVKELKKKWNIDKPSGVDSELVAQFIDKHGIMELPSFMVSTQGSSSVAAVHDGKLYVMRDGNPLEYLRIKIGENVVTVFASTEEMVMNSARHIWLLPNWQRTITAGDGNLYHVTADAVEQLGESIKYQPSRRRHGHSYGRSYSAGYDHEGYYGDDVREDYPRYRPPPPSRSASTPPDAAPTTTGVIVSGGVTLPLHNNQRDQLIQAQLGPNWRLVREGGRTFWAMVTEEQAEKEQASKVVKLSRKERRRLAREQAAAQVGPSAVEGDRAGAEQEQNDFVV